MMALSLRWHTMLHKYLQETLPACVMRVPLPGGSGIRVGGGVAWVFLSYAPHAARRRRICTLDAWLADPQWNSCSLEVEGTAVVDAAAVASASPAASAVHVYIYIYRSSEPILIVYIVYVVIKKLINDGSLIHSLGTTYPNVDLVELPE